MVGCFDDVGVGCVVFWGGDVYVYICCYVGKCVGVCYVVLFVFEEG